MSEEKTEYAVAVRNETGMLSVKQVGDRVNAVHQILKTVMKENTHYGTVPGCGNKMVLLKPGADVLAMTFRLIPKFEINRMDFENGHREYEITCSMLSPDGTLLGQGVGSASTMEKKYRYRWEGSGGDRKQIENTDIADVYNTVLKIAKKRAHIDATLTVTGAADLFTQDLIDDEDQPGKKPVAEPQRKSQAQNQPSDDAQQSIVGKITKLAAKPTKTGKKRFGICLETSDGEVWVNTFSETDAEFAESQKNAETPVRVSYSEGKFGKDLLAIGAAELTEQSTGKTEGEYDALPFE
jgi:hypothetical protein